MPELLTLAEAKLHCRIDQDDEDPAVQAMVNAAIAAVADYLNMDLDDLDDTAPAPVKSAALLLVGDLYANREAVTERPAVRNPTFALLLNPYLAMEV